MKRLYTSFIVLTICWIITPVALLAQNKSAEKYINPNSIEEIIFDFKDKKFISNLRELDSLKEGDLYQLKITNINMNLYKVIIKGKDSTINSNVDFPMFESVGLNALSTVLTGLSPLSTFAIQTGNILNEMPNKDFTKFIKSSNLAFLQPSLKEQKENESVRTQMNEFIDNLKYKGNELRNINLKIDGLKLSIQKKALSYMLADLNSLYYKELDGDLNFDTILAQSEKLRIIIKKVMKQIEEKTKEYNEFVKKNKTIIDKDNELKKMNNELKKAFTATAASADKVYTVIDADKVNSWLSSIIHLQNNIIPEYLSLPMQLNGDFTTLEISIGPKKDEYGLPKYQTEIKFPVPQKTYICIGMSFYFSSLCNETYSIKATMVDSTTTDYSIVDEEPKESEIGIATLLHFGKKSEKIENLGIHFTIGPALSISNTVKPRLVLGGGFAYGKKQMITIDILGMAGYVDNKSEVYDINEIYSSKPEQITVSKLSFGIGIAIGYTYKF